MEGMKIRNTIKDDILLYLCDDIIAPPGWSKMNVTTTYGFFRQYYIHRGLLVSAYKISELKGVFSLSTIRVNKLIKELEDEGKIITVKGEGGYRVFIVGYSDKDGLHKYLSNGGLCCRKEVVTRLCSEPIFNDMGEEL